LEELKTNLDTKDQELRTIQLTLQALKSEKEHYQFVIGKLEEALEEQKNYVRHYEDRTTIMESELTQNFILHNE
jgi:predicted  nucleic acid-binding Zn-ribbon protein